MRLEIVEKEVREMEKSIRPYVFISYAHKDNAIVLPLIEDLKARGFHVWYDAGIEAGTEWPDYIGTKVFYCNCMIFFLSPNSAVSSNCRREVDFAVALEKRVLAIHLVDDGELQLSHGLQMTLNNKQAMFYTRSPSKEQFLDNLSQAEILKECRITDEWDVLYAKDEEVLPQFEASAISPLKAPKEQKNLDPEKARSKAEREFALGCNQENEGNLEKAFVHYESAANQGHPEAMFRLAECLQQGKGTGKNESEAYLWYQRAGEHGVTEAMLRQAKFFEMTNGTQKGREKAALLLSIAARLNNTEAMYTLGMLYLKNHETDEQLKEGIAWLEAAAKREHIEAMYQLGVYYRETNPEDSLKWLDAAAYWRHPEALYALGQHFLQQEQKEEGNKWILLAAQKGCFAAADWLCDGHTWGLPADALIAAYIACAEKGHDRAMFALAEIYRKGITGEENPELAAKWYRQAAYAGNLVAFYRWAECCYYGKGTPRNYDEAYTFYQKSYDRGDFWVVTSLAECYRHGRGVAQNEKQAFEYLTELDYTYSAYREAHYLLAEYHELGIGTPKNPEKAFVYCRYAAEFGYEAAYGKLARYYEIGFGTEINQERAAAWYRQAAEAGSVGAMLETAERYATGNGTEKRPEDAYAWYQRAAEQSVEAQYLAAICVMQGFGTQKNEDKALGELYVLADVKQYPQAALYIAQYYEKTGERQAALQCYLMAVAGGSEEAMTKIKQRGFRRMCWLRLREYLQAKRAYQVYQGQYASVEIPWKQED